MSSTLRAERVARGQAAFPLRVVVTNSGRLSSDLKLFQAKAGSIIIFTSSWMSRPAEERFRSLGVEVVRHSGPAVTLLRMLQQLRRNFRVRSLVCEGGATLLRSLLEHELVDRLHLTICPAIFGGRSAPTLTGLPGAFLPRTISLHLTEMKVSADGECFVEYRVK